MVHEGFTASTGRTVLVRTDDLTECERVVVSEFFRVVQQVRKLDDRPHDAAFGTFVIPFILALLAGSHGVAWFIGMGCLAVILSAFAYAVMSRYVRAIMPAMFEELLAIVQRNERCRIAATQLRQASETYARLLPQLDAPATAR